MSEQQRPADPIVNAQADWARESEQLAAIRAAGELVNDSLQDARTELHAATDRGEHDTAEALQDEVTALEVELERLRGDWRHQRQVEATQRAALQRGDDIAMVPRHHVQQIDRAARQAGKNWRDDPVSVRQSRLLHRLLAEAGISLELAEFTLTKGLASEAINSARNGDAAAIPALLEPHRRDSAAPTSAPVDDREPVVDAHVEAIAEVLNDPERPYAPLVYGVAAATVYAAQQAITEDEVEALQDAIDLTAVANLTYWDDHGTDTQLQVGPEELAVPEADPVVDYVLDVLPPAAAEDVAQQFERGAQTARDRHRKGADSPAVAAADAALTLDLFSDRPPSDAAPAVAVESKPEPASALPSEPAVGHEPERPPHAEPEIVAPVREAPPAAGANFAMGTDVLVPSGEKSRAQANIDAIRLVQQLDVEGRAASVEEQSVLAKWSGWGAAPTIFDRRNTDRRWVELRSELEHLLGRKGLNEASASTLNAHYTDPAIVSEMWRALQRAGLPEGAAILEPGCGAGYFLGTAPAGVRMTGVELEPITARIAAHLFPQAQVRNHGFERPFAADETFTGAIGNVPFGKTGVLDPVHNAAGLSLHNQFIYKALALTQPGGYVAVITSAYTSNAARPDARREITRLGDLVGAVRLPSGAFDRQAATAVVTDVLIFRRREPDAAPTADTVLWANNVVGVDLPGRNGQLEMSYLNQYFQTYPQRVLGTSRVANSLNGPGLVVDADTATPLGQQLRSQLDEVIDNAVATGLGFTAPTPELAANPDLAALVEPGLHFAADPGTEILPGSLRFNEVTEGFEQFTLGGGWNPVACSSKQKIGEWKLIIAMGETMIALTDAARNPASTRGERDQLRAQLNTLYDSYVGKYGPLNRFKLTQPQELTDAKIAEKLDELVTAWRNKAGRSLAVDEGLDPEEAEPYDGPIPSEVLEEMRDKAATPIAPYQKRYHLEGALTRDPRLGMVLSIEDYKSSSDGSNSVASKGAIFTVDASAQRTQAATAASVEEAVAICFDETGSINPARIAELLDLSLDDALERARGKIFPSLDGSETWEVAATFLAGNVRDKHAAALIAYAADPVRFAGVPEALAAVIPVDLDPADIGVRPGATWVPIEDYKQFLIEEFGITGKVTVELAITGEWSFKSTQKSRHEIGSNGYADQYGNHRLPGVEMFEMLANNKPIRVNKSKEELEAAPKPTYHEKLTNQARAASDALSERFEKWLWLDPDRYQRLARIFNDTFNSYVKPRHDPQFKAFPGIRPGLDPYDYQAAAVQRFLHDETVLLDHVVGAGKTLTITASCMEAKRLGQIRQPWIVVPNHLVGQWAKEARDAYPDARILVAADVAKPKPSDRQQFVGQTAARDWDLVIVPQSVFGLVGLKREAKIAYIEGEIESLRQALWAANESGSEFSVKQIEQAIKAQRKRLEGIIEGKTSDDGLTFEQSGCDFIFVDEAHEYKNLTRTSNSPDLSVSDGSQRASDMEMKARYLRERGRERNIAAGRPDAPVKAVAFATGTPISNSLSEIWVMTKYLRPDILEAAGMGRIDNWAATFARPVTAAEVNITGTSLRMVNRMAEYQNVRQLVAQVDQYRDVVVSEQIPVTLPKMSGGGPRTVEFDLPSEVHDFMSDLEERLANIDGAHMELDNSLKIANDGRNATMHPGLAGLGTPADEHSRIQVAADLIWNCHIDNADLVIPADKKFGPPMTGVFQMVFCDRGTPKAGASPRARNVYTDLRDALVERGMDPADIAFIHDYPSPKQKAKLFAACNSGEIRVLIASSKKAGTGVNVQRAMKQLINLDPAWTAEVMEQRLGRIIRQGNVHREVDVINIVARRSYDAMMYQYVARKAGFVAQLRREDAPQRMEDLGGDLSLSWAQSKAAATGDAVYVQQVEAEQKVTTLSARRDAIHNANAARTAAIRSLRRDIASLEERLPDLTRRHELLNAWLGADPEDRTWRIDGHDVPDSESPELVAALQKRLTTLTSEQPTRRNPAHLATIGGQVIEVLYLHEASLWEVNLGGLVRHLQRDKWEDTRMSDSATRGFATVLRNLARSVRDSDALADYRLSTYRDKLDGALAEPNVAFEQDAELDAARRQAEDLRMEVNAREHSPEALIAKRESEQRRRADGQYRGWTLDLNATPAHAAKVGLNKADLRKAVPALMSEAAYKWAIEAPARATVQAQKLWKPGDVSEYEWLYGAAQGSDVPGARTWWHGRQWHWSAWDGFGRLRNGAADRRFTAQSESEAAVQELANDRKFPIAEIQRVGRERRDPRLPEAINPSSSMSEDILRGLRAASEHTSDAGSKHTVEHEQEGINPPEPDSGTGIDHSLDR